MAIDVEFLGPFAAAALGGWTARVAARGWLREQQRPAGWVAARPGEMHWIGFVGSVSIVCLMAYVGLFIGSSRADAAFQMRILWLLVAAFSLGAGTCLWQMRQIMQTDARWRGTRISWQPAGGGRRLSRDLSEVAGMHRPWFGPVRIAFFDGAELRIDPYATRVPELWNRIVDVNQP